MKASKQPSKDGAEPRRETAPKAARSFAEDLAAVGIEAEVDETEAEDDEAPTAKGSFAADLKAARAAHDRDPRTLAKKRREKQEAEWESQYDELGRDAFLANIERMRVAGPQAIKAVVDIRDRKAKAAIAWLERHEREQREVAEEAADDERRGREVNQILEQWRSYIEAEEIQVPNLSPGAVLDRDGECILDPINLEVFGALCDLVVRRDEVDDLTQALQWHARNGGKSPIKHPPTFTDRPRYWAIVTDRRTTVPPGLSDAAREKWSEKWRDSVPELRGSELCVYAEGGEHVTFVVWWDAPRSSSDVKAWCDRISGDVDDEKEPRFQAREQWRLPEESVYLPGENARATALTLRERARANALPTTVLLDTGIASLNAQLRGGGIPLGTRVLIAGRTGQCKTTLALHLAEAASDQGWFVLWLAYDERAALITSRRLQRRGLSPEAARLLPQAELEKLEQLPFVVLDPDKPYEDLVREAFEEAGERPLLIVIDSIQKSETRAGRDKGERERLTAAVDTIVEYQARYPAIVVATSELARGSEELKGSGALDYGGELTLKVQRTEALLNVAIAKSRIGGEQPFKLALGAAAQRLSDADVAKAQQAVAAVHDGVWEQVKAALGKHGPKSRSGLKPWVTTKDVTLVDVLRSRVAAGELVREGRQYRLP